MLRRRFNRDRAAGKEERKCSFGTKRRFRLNPFPSNEHFQNRETYVSEKGENPQACRQECGIRLPPPRPRSYLVTSGDNALSNQPFPASALSLVKSEARTNGDAGSGCSPGVC